MLNKEMSSFQLATESELEKTESKRPTQIVFTQLRIVKNLVVLSIGGLLSFSAYSGLGVFQSTLNRDDGIGVISLSIQYGCGCISALLTAKYFLKKLGSKSVLTVTSASYVIYVTANLYPSWYLLIPASVIVGLANSLFWAAECHYLNGLSILYVDHLKNHKESFEDGHKVQRHYGTQRACGQVANCRCVDQSIKQDLQSDTIEKDNITFPIEEIGRNTRGSNELVDRECQLKKCANKCTNIENELSYYHAEASTSSLKIFKNGYSVSSDISGIHESEIVESTTSRVFGFHGLIFQTCHIWSNLLSYYLLKNGLTDNDYINNSTCQCGAEFCNVETECFVHNLQEPTEQMKFILLGSFVAISLLAVLIVALFLDKLEMNEDGPVRITWEAVFASVRHMKNQYEIHLAPSIVLLGMTMGFVMGDFNKAYVGCAWGMHHVGLVSACFGACLALFCSLSGWFVKRAGRVPIFLIGETAISSAGVLLLTWYPDAENSAMFFVIAGLFGVYFGIFWSQLRAFYGILFKEDEEVAFGNYNIYFSIGASMSFGYSNFLCTSKKIYILITISIIG